MPSDATSKPNQEGNKDVSFGGDGSMNSTGISPALKPKRRPRKSIGGFIQKLTGRSSVESSDESSGVTPVELSREPVGDINTHPVGEEGDEGADKNVDVTSDKSSEIVAPQEISQDESLEPQDVHGSLTQDVSNESQDALSNVEDPFQETQQEPMKEPAQEQGEPGDFQDKSSNDLQEDQAVERLGDEGVELSNPSVEELPPESPQDSTIKPIGTGLPQGEPQGESSDKPSSRSSKKDDGLEKELSEETPRESSEVGELPNVWTNKLPVGKSQIIESAESTPDESHKMSLEQHLSEVPEVDESHDSVSDDSSDEDVVMSESQVETPEVKEVSIESQTDSLAGPPDMNEPKEEALPSELPVSVPSSAALQSGSVNEKKENPVAEPLSPIEKPPEEPMHKSSEEKPGRLSRFVSWIKSLPGAFLHIMTYMILILVYGVLHMSRRLSKKIELFKKVERSCERLVDMFDRPQKGSISRVELIDLAVQNMKAKSSRTTVTIGGMMVGIAAIVFLVSIGYGVQALVINRVARLEEMRQTDVTTPPGSNLFMDDDVIEEFKEIPSVGKVLPQLAVVGKVNLNESLTDMAVYGVTRDYLEESAISPVIGETFESNETQTDIVAETEIEELPSSDDPEIKDEYLTGEWVEIEGLSDTVEQLQVSKVKFPQEIQSKQAVVNRAFLQVLDIDEADALESTFSVSFIATGRSLSEGQDRVESTPTEYTVIGVTPDDLTPLFYIPLVHLKALGIENYSQTKIVVDDEQNLETVRSEVESRGYVTSSVVDTVAQINSLFSTLRVVLALLGTVALTVAALGMFNTLTVSLLERTREVGLLKAMGMKSYEIRDLFLAESMMMGTLGGLMGILFGVFIGKLLELILTLVALGNGLGWITIVRIPPLFALLIIFLSFLVGVVTGIYPARRATKISALNALRYE